VAIPSWKRRGNPLPGLVVQQLIGPPWGGRTLPLLERSRPTLGQHHLDRQLRLSNQEGTFRLRPGPRPALAQLKRQPIWLVDDILTTGATALAAAGALEQAGLTVKGLLYLAGGRYNEYYFPRGIALCLRELGRWGEMLAWIRTAREAARLSGQEGHQVDASMLEGECQAALGDVDAARACWVEARQQAMACGMTSTVTRAKQLLHVSTTDPGTTP
jgi:hypothetical protein